MTGSPAYSLAELVIVAAAEAWRGNGEILASGIGIIPRLGAGLAKLTHSPDLLLTDGEAFLVEEPVPLGQSARASRCAAGWMPYSRVFELLWKGRRHAMVMPAQIDRWGQTNISCLGDFRRPKVQMLGVRGFPGNSISHANSLFVPSHGTRAFVAGEVDMVAGAGFKAERWPPGTRAARVDLRFIVTDLCVMDFGSDGHAIRVRSLHPGTTFDEVQAATGFPLQRVAEMPTTRPPDAEELAIIRRLDPDDQRATVLKGNPPGVRRSD
ncbi:MAG: ketoacid CoA transferase [Proteobacteria bacterium]|nr:ketoacid CoA transferase [Pseudomonadota bacterium]